MHLEAITPLVITFNEEDNIRRNLSSLRWARRVIILDSGSTDATVKIASEFENVDLIHRQFISFADQCNYGLGLVKTEWALSLDADYVLDEGFAEEIERGVDDQGKAGFRASFIYCVNGRALRGTLYPPRAVLYRTSGATYVQHGHGHKVQIDGVVGDLKSKIYHDDRKPLWRWFASQQNYAAAEAEYLLTARSDDLRRVDRVRRMGWPAPLLVFLYTLIVKRCFLDGFPGWLYVMQRTCAEIMIALEVIDRSMKKNAAKPLRSDQRE
ncbi:glycosyltransferase family 2 protein [Alsobacter sp. R-9]